MKIQIGEVYMDKVTQQKIPYPNKTKKYLLPCLREYGSVFLKKINDVFKVAAGIGDVIVSNRREKSLEKHIFILVDSKIAPKHFIEFLEWIKDEEYYEDDYVYDDIQKSTYHMIVLKFPEKHYESFQTFKKGEYSKMFDKEYIDSFFQHHPDSKKVFIKDHNYRITFTNKVNRIFGTTVKPEEWEGELDFPPNDKTEIFNHHLKK